MDSDTSTREKSVTTIKIKQQKETITPTHRRRPTRLPFIPFLRKGCSKTPHKVGTPSPLALLVKGYYFGSVIEHSSCVLDNWIFGTTFSFHTFTHPHPVAHTNAPVFQQATRDHQNIPSSRCVLERSLSTAQRVQIIHRQVRIFLDRCCAPVKGSPPTVTTINVVDAKVTFDSLAVFCDHTFFFFFFFDPPALPSHVTRPRRRRQWPTTAATFIGLARRRSSRAQTTP